MLCSALSLRIENQGEREWSSQAQVSSIGIGLLKGAVRADETPDCKKLGARSSQKLVCAEGRLPDDLVEASLGETEQALLAKLLLEESGAWQDNTERMVEDCLQTIAREGRKGRYQELKQMMSEAEQAGDWEQFALLSKEYQELKKSLER